MTGRELEEVPPPGTPRNRWDYLPRYVGPNWGSFEPTARALKTGRLGLSWSWAAFFFPLLWMVYRRRVLWFLLLFAATSLPSFAPIDLDGRNLEVLLMLALGIFGRSLYLRGALRRIDHIIATVPDEMQRAKQVDLAGGTDSNAVMVVILLMVVGSVAILAYLAPEMQRGLEQMQANHPFTPKAP